MSKLITFNSFISWLLLNIGLLNIGVFNRWGSVTHISSPKFARCQSCHGDWFFIAKHTVIAVTVAFIAKGKATATTLGKRIALGLLHGERLG